VHYDLRPASIARSRTGLRHRAPALELMGAPPGLTGPAAIPAASGTDSRPWYSDRSCRTFWAERVGFLWLYGSGCLLSGVRISGALFDGGALVQFLGICRIDVRRKARTEMNGVAG